MPGSPLRRFNTLTRRVSGFEPRNLAKVGMYSCGPTVYAYEHIGNMRAPVFTDTLKRTLRWKGFDVRHLINISNPRARRLARQMAVRVGIPSYGATP